VQIIISFKKNEKWMFDLINNHSGKSTFVKDIIEEHYENKKPSGNKRISNHGRDENILKDMLGGFGNV
jgi:hypothetical protein